MLKSFLLSLVFSCTISTVFAQNQFVSLEAKVGEIVTNQFENDEPATIYFLRSTGFQGGAVAFTAFIDGELVCKLNNKRYSIHEIPPGEHTFTVQFAGKKSKKKAEPITFVTEAGKTYYIQMMFQTGFFANNLYCQEVTENSANTVLPDLKEDTKCLKGSTTD